MLFNFGLKSSFLLIFFFHGLVFAILLFIKGIQNNDKSSYWLSFYTFLCTLYISPFMLGYAGWYSRNPYRDILFYTPFQQLFLIPPVLYFYFKTLFDKSFVFRAKDFLHFVPAFIYFLYSIGIFFIDKVILGKYYFYQDERDKDFAFEYQAVGFVFLVFYAVRSLHIYQRYKATTYNTVSYADSLTFRWAQRFLLALLLLLLIRGLFFILNPEWANFGRKFWYYLLFSFLFYYISISGYINSIRSVVSLNDLSANNNLDLSTAKVEITIASDSEAEKLLDNKNEIPDLEIWKNKIEKMMLIDKIYENPELSIYHLAQKLATHPKKISQVINQGFSMNFNDFINQQRVKAVIQKMEAGEHSLQTLLGLALECGFNSKSTFNRAFKRLTALSPNEYIKKNFPE
jgi:AraC-like DNA-binding protein